MNEKQLAQPTLYLAEEMEGPLFHRLGGGTAAVYSAHSPAKDTPNEDAAALIPFGEQSAVLAVADGLGGVRAGGQASCTAVQALREAVEKAANENLSLREAVINGIESANSAIQEPGVGSATTIAVAEIQGNVLRPYHVGDSIILVAGQRGKLKLETVAHSPVGFAVELGIIDAADAMHHDQRHVVSNVLGTPNMRIEVGSALKLAPRDRVVIATDGLTDNLNIAEIVERVRKDPIEKAVQRLIHDTKQRMTTPQENQPSKPDDLTLILFGRNTHSMAKQTKAGMS